ncbi:CapA family protein [Ramlibacter tataouinensis]|uniref:CapA family protein n=1 Tax=Ramlibacter tataouinensis TaxID=94132 RepID=UPI0022F3EEA1|nr:CapA family protein [Ramlibacter tataouinensis]WBY02295.1 CapA family protein [Ramlibacter tataouinensis]
MQTTTLLLAGDVMTGRGIDQVLAHPGPARLFEAWVRDARDYVRLAEAKNGPVPAPVDPAYVWGDALAAMDRAAPELRIVNLETAVTRSEDAWPGKGIHYRMHPANVGCLTAARLDACTLANNHVLDWGRAGLRETLATLAGAGIRTAGAGLDAAGALAPAALPLPGPRRVLLTARATPDSGVPAAWAASAAAAGIALLDALDADAADDLAAQVERVRRPGDISVVSLHWGGNWGFDIPAAHRAFAHRLIDRGAADLVHGHSSHHALPIEVHRGRAILYGCGDLLNDYEGIETRGDLRSDLGCLYLVRLAPDGALQQLEILPMQLRRLRLAHADAQARAWLRRAFGEHGRPLGTGVDDGPEGRFVLRWR